MLKTAFRRAARRTLSTPALLTSLFLDLLVSEAASVSRKSCPAHPARFATIFTHCLCSNPTCPGDGVEPSPSPGHHRTGAKTMCRAREWSSPIRGADFRDHSFRNPRRRQDAEPRALTAGCGHSVGLRIPSESWSATMARNPTNGDEPRMVRSHHPQDEGGPERSSGRGIPKGVRPHPCENDVIPESFVHRRQR